MQCICMTIISHSSIFIIFVSDEPLQFKVDPNTAISQTGGRHITAT